MYKRQESMELVKSKAGNPTVKAVFEIVTGASKGKKIYYNQTVHTGYGIKSVSYTHLLQNLSWFLIL